MFSDTNMFLLSISNLSTLAPQLGVKYHSWHHCQHWQQRITWDSGKLNNKIKLEDLKHKFDLLDDEGW